MKELLKSKLLKVCLTVIAIMIVPLCFFFPDKIPLLAGVSVGFILLATAMWFILGKRGG